METINTLSIIAGILIIPLIPAFVIYKFLPSKTVVKGPFKGLNVNLTGAFGGYFLLVIISLGFTYFSLNNAMKSALMEAEAKNAKLNLGLNQLKNEILGEKAKFQSWEISGSIDSNFPESTKIFVDEDQISINSVGKFKAMLLLQSDAHQRAQLPTAVCFFKKGEGYHVIDLTKKELVKIDTSLNRIEIKVPIKLKIPQAYAYQ